jgi:hypothetical protein
MAVATGRLPIHPGDKYWVCEVTFHNADHEANCPRCGKPCAWMTRHVVYSRGPVAQGTLHSPLCECPDAHIREGVARLLAEVLVKAIRCDVEGAAVGGDHQ